MKTKSTAQTFFICGLLATLTLLVFWPVLDCGFLNYDDDGYVTANAHVQSGLSAGNIAWTFRTIETANWHPVTWLSLMLDSQLFGSDAMGFHRTNLIIHVAVVILLFLFLEQVSGARWQSAFIAMLFGLHPLHVESVAWISERKDVLSAFFFMLTLLAYARFARKKSIAGYWLAILFFTLGLMSKPMLVTLPFILLLLDFWPLNRIGNSGFE